MWRIAQFIHHEKAPHRSLEIALNIMIIVPMAVGVSIIPIGVVHMHDAMILYPSSF